MHIGIDITPLLYGRGVSRYTENLVQALAELSSTHLHLYGSTLRQQTELKQKAKKLISESKDPSHHRQTIQAWPPKAHHWMWNVLGVSPLKPVMPEIEVFHSWDWLQPPDADLPLVSTIHDLAILKFPETAHPNIKMMHEYAWKRLKERQAQLIAVSHSTKRDMMEMLDIPAERIHVVHEALPQEIREVSESIDEEEYQRIRARLNLNQPFVFFVGTREPRKNLERLIKAWEPLHKDFQLIIAGESGWDKSASFSAKYPDQLRFLGKVSDQALAVLYGEASVLAYPCLYEGFGLPILEAFYHGTPVLTSNTSSMIEVAGNAAELVNPESIEDIRRGLKIILSESVTDQQKRLQKMIIRLQMFSWKRVAQETLAVYKKAIEERQ